MPQSIFCGICIAVAWFGSMLAMQNIIVWQPSQNDRACLRRGAWDLLWSDAKSLLSVSGVIFIEAPAGTGKGAVIPHLAFKTFGNPAMITPTKDARNGLNLPQHRPRNARAVRARYVGRRQWPCGSPSRVRISFLRKNAGCDIFDEADQLRPEMLYPVHYSEVQRAKMIFAAATSTQELLSMCRIGTSKRLKLEVVAALCNTCV